MSPSHVDDATIVLDGEDLDEEETDPPVPTTVRLNIPVMIVQRRKWNGTHLCLLPLLCHRRRLFQLFLLRSLHSN